MAVERPGALLVAALLVPPTAFSGVGVCTFSVNNKQDNCKKRNYLKVELDFCRSGSLFSYMTEMADFW